MTPLKENIVPAGLITLSAIGITFALYSMKVVLVPFVFSILLYFVISPLIQWLRTTCRLPRIIALLITFTIVSSIFTGFILILGISIKNLIDSGRLYYSNLFILVDQISNSPILSRLNIKLDFGILEQFLRSLPILDWISYLSSSVFSIISNVILVLIFLLFIAIGEKSKTIEQIFDDEVESTITRYITTKFFTSMLTAVLTFIVLVLFQVDLALFLASLTFFFNFIPNIGSIIVILAAAPILFIQFGFSFLFFILIGILFLIQFLIGNILDPKIMGENLGLHPVVILLSLLFWGYIWGISGMFLAVPLSATIKILISRSKIAYFFVKTLETDIKQV